MIFKEANTVSQFFSVGDTIKVKDNYPEIDLRGKEGKVIKSAGAYFPVTAKIEGVGSISEYCFYDDELERVFNK